MQKSYLVMLFLGSFLLISLLLPSLSVQAASNLPSGTKVAGVSVEKMTEKEVRERLETKINDWQTGQALLLQSEFEQMKVPRTAFEFNIDTTMNQLQEATKRHWSSFFLKPKNVHMALNVTLRSNSQAINDLSTKDYIDTDAVKQLLLDTVESLKDDAITIEYKDETAIPFEEIAELEVRLPETPRPSLQEIVAQIDGYVIEPETSFSYLQNLTIYQTLVNDKQNTTLASGLYELFLQTNFDIVERNIQKRPPAKDKRGTEALVHVEDHKDLIVYNPNALAFVIEAEQTEKTIHLKLKSTYNEMTHEIEMEKEKINYRTVYRYSEDLLPGAETVIRNGEPGLEIRTYQTSLNKDRIPIDTVLLHHDIYLPSPEIRLVSAQEEVAIEEAKTGEDNPVDEAEFSEAQESIDELEKQLSTIEENDTDSKDVKQEVVETIHEQIDDLQSQYDTLEERFNQFNEVVRETNKTSATNIENVKKDITALHDQLATMEKQLEALMDSKDNPSGTNEGDTDEAA